jgi:hypothetical protein
MRQLPALNSISISQLLGCQQWSAMTPRNQNFLTFKETKRRQDGRLQIFKASPMASEGSDNMPSKLCKMKPELLLKKNPQIGHS